jgi:hypothetical protein
MGNMPSVPMLNSVGLQADRNANTVQGSYEHQMQSSREGVTAERYSCLQQTASNPQPLPPQEQQVPTGPEPAFAHYQPQAQPENASKPSQQSSETPKHSADQVASNSEGKDALQNLMKLVEATNGNFSENEIWHINAASPEPPRPQEFQNMDSPFNWGSPIPGDEERPIVIDSSDEGASPSVRASVQGAIANVAGHGQITSNIQRSEKKRSEKKRSETSRSEPNGSTRATALQSSNGLASQISSLHMTSESSAGKKKRH